MTTQRVKALEKCGVGGDEMESFLSWVDDYKPDQRYQAEARQLTKGDSRWLSEARRLLLRAP